MKATELMVGDWVLWKNKPVQIVRVSGIRYEFGHYDVLLAYCNNMGDGIENHDISSISPIPLTAEILEKNANGGFGYYDNKSRATYHLHKEKEDVSIYVEWERVYPEPYIELHGLGDTFFKGYCDSVSKLQHALRLCGLNDLADNFQI